MDKPVVTLNYDSGTILVRGAWVPHASWDERVKAYRVLAVFYDKTLRYLREAGYVVNDSVFNTEPLTGVIDRVSLKPIQQTALESWERAGRRGVIVLPTGVGKTYVALKAIARIAEPTLIVVPTIDLLNQWGERVRDLLGYKPGVLGGGRQEIRPITISTYDSAYLWADRLGNKFRLLVFDEVHHLPAQSYRQIAEFSAAPYRMGLTATPERDDGLDEDYPVLVGGIVFRVGVGDIAGKELAPFRVERVYVDLTPEEKREYKECKEVFDKFLKKYGLSMSSQDDFHKLIKLASRDREARRALLARLEMSKIAMNTRAKIEKLREILAEHEKSRIIVFTRYNYMAYEVAREFLIPVITHETNKREREEILDKFRRGEYRVIATSTVLDEGVDVPDATIAVVLGGFGTSRQFIQRLGRVVRKKEGKIAKMIEVITRGTVDYYLSRKRRVAASRSIKSKD